MIYSTTDGPIALAQRIWIHAHRLSHFVSGAGAFMLLAVAALTVVQIILRGVLSSSILGLEEVLSLIVGVSVAACIPAGFTDGRHLRVAGLVDRLPQKTSSLLIALGDILLLFFLCILAAMVFDTAQSYLERGQTTAIMGIEIGPFYLAMAFGFFLAIPIKLARLITGGGSRNASAAHIGLVLLVAIALAALAYWSGLADWLKSGSDTATAFRVFAMMWILMLFGVPLSATMGLAGLAGLSLMLSWSPAVSVAGSETSMFLTSQSLAVLPLFLLMGSLASLAGLSSDIYRFSHALLSPLRAGLCHATILACAGFGALTGSSLATAATFGRIALPEMEKRGYDKGLAAGSVAAGGTLGSLVPPSTAMILYALLSEQSIGRLFIAAMVPALLAIVLYMITISIAVRINPRLAPKGSPIDWHELAGSAKACIGALILFGSVIGGIYSGIFTDSEAASVGVIGALLIALIRGRITRASLVQSLIETTTTISIIYMLIFGALTFSFFLAFSGIPTAFAVLVQSFGLTPMAIIFALVLCYLVLGAVMDSYAMMVITIPVFGPLILGMGFDPIWWGVITVICVELGMITPPFGLNLFVIQSVSPSLPLSKLWRGVMPFVIADLVKLGILLAIPGLLLMS